MKTLKDLKKDIENLIKKYPEFENLPICYASDDEGNSYQKVHNSLSPAQFHDINEYSLELVGFLDEDNPNGDIINDNEEGDICYKDVNGIVIN